MYSVGGLGYRNDTKAFLFSLRNNAGLAPFKLDVSTETGSNAIYTNWNYHLTYGGGHDLKIVDNPNSNTNSYTNLGSSYKVPTGYQPHATDTKDLLAGSYNYVVDEIEVFYTSKSSSINTLSFKLSTKYTAKNNKVITYRFNKTPLLIGCRACSIS